VVTGEGSPRDAAPTNRLAGKVRQAVYSGSSTTYKIETGTQVLTVFEQNRAARTFAPGEAVALTWSPRHSVVVRP
jgi:putative spermidine/putrescine transport system ATP-binding protein/spermidine/putrescine transport system ATP-binding protein